MHSQGRHPGSSQGSCAGYPLHLQTGRRLAAPSGEPGVGSLLLAAGLLTAPDGSPARGFSSRLRVPQRPEWEGKPGAPPLAVGIPRRPEWGGQSGVPPAGCGVPTAQAGNTASVLPSRCKGPSSRLRGSPWLRVGTQPRVSLSGWRVPTTPSGSPAWGSLSRLRGSYSPAGSTEWGPASMLKGSYGPGWDPRVRPLLRAAGFL